jgi:hypothetical protein
MEHEVKRPELTFPERVADLVRGVYSDASVILEYGSGGSTVLAAELGKEVFSVESDANWAKGLSEFLAANNLAQKVMVYHVDVGPTGPWGKPVDNSRWQSFWQYPLSIWSHPNFQQPDVVLVDGRFRTACLLASVFMTEKPITILVDDYGHRDRYRVIEKIIEPVNIVHRMGVFKVEPTTVDRRHFPLIVSEFFQVSMAASALKARPE